MIQLTRAGTVFSGSARDLECLRGRFERDHCLRFPAFLEPELLRFAQAEIAQAQFDERVHEAVLPPAVDLCMVENRAWVVLCLCLMNDPVLFDLLQRSTGCPSIASFDGCVYRMTSDSRHRDAWHGDLGRSRIIAASINLSTEAFSGGALQIRDAVTKAIVHEVANTGPGDAVVFRLSADLEHRVGEVRGAAPRTAFAGWFRSEPMINPLVGRQ